MAGLVVCCHVALLGLNAEERLVVLSGSITVFSLCDYPSEGVDGQLYYRARHGVYADRVEHHDARPGAFTVVAA
jgi:hypothetical protein